MLKIVQCEHRKIFKVCFAIFQHNMNERLNPPAYVWFQNMIRIAWLVAKELKLLKGKPNR